MKSNRIRAVGTVARSDRYLKSENQIWLFGFLVVNLAAFAVVTYIGLDGVSGAIQWVQSNWESLSAVGLGVVVTTVVSNLISPQLKAVLVFWRWPNPLPGHRAFSRYLGKDPRIDPHRLQDKVGDFQVIRRNKIVCGIESTGHMKVNPVSWVHIRTFF